MTIKYHMDLLQGSDEWHKIRLGMLTASNVKKILTPKLKQANNDKTKSLVFETVVQRSCGFGGEHFQSFAMQRGTVEEIYAKDLYTKNKSQVKDCGFITNDKFGFMIGCSPDGLVGEYGGIEAKGRIQSIQGRVIIGGVVPDDDMLQVQASLLVSGRKWWDYLSYSNGLPMFIKRVEPNETYFNAIETAAFNFEKDVKEKLEIYMNNIQGLPVADHLDYFDGEEISPSYTNVTMAG